MDDKLFSTWLHSTRQLQTEAYGIDYSVFDTSHADGINALVEYMRWNMLAIDDELAEMRKAISWKPWQHDDPYADVEEVVKEAVDVLHFVANILVASGATDEALDAFYREKMQRNRERQLGGYRVRDAGVKCIRCARALDDVGVSSIDVTVCAKCEE